MCLHQRNAQNVEERSLKISSPLVLPPESNSLPTEQTNSEESPCGYDPLCFDFTKKQMPSYSEQQQKSAHHWSEIREHLLHAAVETYGFSVFWSIVCDNTAIYVLRLLLLATSIKCSFKGVFSDNGSLQRV